MDSILFPFAEYWWLYLSFAGLVILLLAADLGIFHRNAHAVSFREAALWSVVWIVLSLGCGLALYQYAQWKFPQDPRLLAIPGFDPQAAAEQVGLEFLAGYLIEKCLSVDNIFVFVVIFGYFAIPRKYQHRVLVYGILGALVFRAVFIGAGSALMQYHLVTVLFGALLVVTGIKMVVVSDNEVRPERNLLIRLFRRFVPTVSELHGPRFFVRMGRGLYATPLLVALLFIEMTDVVFAVDSVPAIFALTREPLIVFTSNICAILGLRAMYFLLAGAVDKFHLLKYGLAAVLVFVGLKMLWLNGWYDGEFPIAISLGAISGTVAASIVLSLVFPRSALDNRSEPANPE